MVSFYNKAYYAETEDGKLRRQRRKNITFSHKVQSPVLYLQLGTRASMEDMPRLLGLQLAFPFLGMLSDQLRQNEH